MYHIYIGIFFNLQFNFSYDHIKVHLHCHYRTTDRILITLNNYRLLLDKRWTCGQRYASNLLSLNWSNTNIDTGGYSAKADLNDHLPTVKINMWLNVRAAIHRVIHIQTFEDISVPTNQCDCYVSPHTSVERSCFSNDRFGKMCLLNYRFKCDLSIRIIKTLNLEESM